MADLQTLERAFLKAHNAGDQRNAAVLAREIKRMRAEGGEAPKQEAAPQWSDLPGNIPGSAWNAATGMVDGIYNMVNHPVQTVQSLNDLGQGAAMNVDALQQANAWLADRGLARRRDLAAEEASPENAMADAAGQAIYDRYGSLGNLKRTMINDPVGAGLDAAGLLTGVGGAVRAIRGAPAASTIAGLTRPAQKILVEAAPKNANALDHLGNSAMLLDANPAMTGIAQGVATKPGTASDGLLTALKTRSAERGNRLVGDVRGILGPMKDPEMKKAAIDTAARNTAAPIYDNAKTHAPKLGPQFYRQTARQLKNESLSPSGRSTLSMVRGRVRDALRAKDPKATAERLHRLRMDLDSMIDPGPLATSAEKMDRSTLIGARKVIDDALKNNVAGFDTADQVVAASKKLQDDIDFGFNALEGGKTAMFPDSYATDFKGRNAQRVQEGMTARIGGAMGTSGNDLSAVKRIIGDGNDFNRAKIAETFGPQKTDDLAAAVDREQLFAQNEAAISANSQTARRQAAQKIVEPPDAPKITGQETIPGLLMRGGAGIVNKVIGFGATKYSAKTADSLAKALALSGPEARGLLGELVKAKSPVSRYRAVVRALEKSARITGAAGATRAPGLLEYQ